MISDIVILVFGIGMVWYGSQLVALTWNTILPSLGISGAFDYLPVVGGGVLIALFALERIVQRLAGAPIDDVAGRGSGRGRRRTRQRPRLRQFESLTRWNSGSSSASSPLLMLIGTPIAFCLGVASFATVLYMGLPPLVVFQRMNSGMSVFSLLAIPFFIYAGDLMVRGGIAQRIVAFAASLSAMSGAGWAR